MDILKDVDNKIIQSEYVKMVSTILEIDENSMLKELNRLGNIDNYTVSAPIKKTSCNKFFTI